MRIPIPLSIISIIAAVGVTWYMRTQHMDFHPPNGIIAGMVDPNAALSPAGATQPGEVGPPKPVDVPDELLAIDMVVDGLDAYSQYRENIPELERTFAIHKADNKVEEAYLVGERLMESPTLSDGVKRELAIQMAKLQSEVMPWVYDHNETAPMTITIGGIPNDAEFRAELSQEVSEMLATSSGEMITTEITFSEGPASIAVQIGDTTLIQDDPDQLQEVIAALYQIIVSPLGEIAPDLTLPQWKNANIEEFEVAITRLAWSKLLAHYIVLPEVAPVTDDPAPVEESEAE